VCVCVSFFVFLWCMCECGFNHIDLYVCMYVCVYVCVTERERDFFFLLLVVHDGYVRTYCESMCVCSARIKFLCGRRIIFFYRNFIEYI